MSFNAEGLRRGRRIQSGVVGRQSFHRSMPYMSYPNDRNGYGLRPLRSSIELCNNYRRTGHFARDSLNESVCSNYGVVGHIASKYPTEPLCRNCKKPGHVTTNYHDEPGCNICGKIGHMAKHYSAHELGLPKSSLCKNCYRPEHILVDCPNEKAYNNCRQSGRLARNCRNNPIRNGCGEPGHIARYCTHIEVLPRSIRPIGGFGDLICHNCKLLRLKSKDCVQITICNICGGRGHVATACPSNPMFL